MANIVHEHHDEMHECPKCSKRSLKQIGESRFHCLSCGFRRNIDEREFYDSGGSLGGLLLVSFVTVILMSLIKPSLQTPYMEPGRVAPQSMEQNA